MKRLIWVVLVVSASGCVPEREHQNYVNGRAVELLRVTSAPDRITENEIIVIGLSDVHPCHIAEVVLSPRIDLACSGAPGWVVTTLAGSRRLAANYLLFVDSAVRVLRDGSLYPEREVFSVSLLRFFEERMKTVSGCGTLLSGGARCRCPAGESIRSTARL